MQHRNNPNGTVMISDPIVQPNSFRTDFIRKTASARSSEDHGDAEQQQQQQRRDTRSRIPRISIPNPFDSPNPSQSSRSPTDTRDSIASNDEEDARPLRSGRVRRAAA